MAQEHDHDTRRYPQGDFTHVPKGTADPYPYTCCHGRDCSPWPAEDIEPIGGGAYRVLSLGVDVPRADVQPLTGDMARLANQLKQPTPYHLCVRRDAATGEIVTPVTVHCLFVGEGM